MVDALEADIKEAEARQHPQVMPTQADKVHTTAQLGETLPTSFAAQHVKSPRNEPNIATATECPRKPHELTVPIQDFLWTLELVCL